MRYKQNFNSNMVYVQSLQVTSQFFRLQLHQYFFHFFLAKFLFEKLNSFIIMVIFNAHQTVLSFCLLLLVENVKKLLRNLEYSKSQNKLNDLILNLTPENTTQHSRIERQSHTKEAQQPPK